MDLHLESFEVFPVLALFFGHMKDSLFWSWLGMKRVLDVFSSLEKFKSVLLLNDANKFTEKPINRLMAVNMSNAYFVWGNVAIQQDGQKKNTNKKKKKKRSAESRKKPL
ncbi:hypothetical protein L798_05550 [Zootermopsis nevadensis]|uniref:Uncharacterized protein n=2 Tax=Zootermopsis nevadensis TaxID=136037 RepID=A0A067R989_ZOONE|nr:hypothetical protein L798_05550 [Zootermopsis nevadensis]